MCAVKQEIFRTGKNWPLIEKTIFNALRCPCVAHQLKEGVPHAGDPFRLRGCAEAVNHEYQVLGLLELGNVERGVVSVVKEHRNVLVKPRVKMEFRADCLGTARGGDEVRKFSPEAIKAAKTIVAHALVIVEGSLGEILHTKSSISVQLRRTKRRQGRRRMPR